MMEAACPWRSRRGTHLVAVAVICLASGCSYSRNLGAGGGAMVDTAGRIRLYATGNAGIGRSNGPTEGRATEDPALLLDAGLGLGAQLFPAAFLVAPGAVVDFMLFPNHTEGLGERLGCGIQAPMTIGSEVSFSYNPECRLGLLRPYGSGYEQSGSSSERGTRSEEAWVDYTAANLKVNLDLRGVRDRSPVLWLGMEMVPGRLTLSRTDF